MTSKSTVPRGRDALTTAAVLYLTANLIHTADHLRQGTGGVKAAVIVGGSALTVSAFIALWLAVRRHRHAARFAANLGFLAVIGISASHIAPDWGPLSDSYPKIHADALSWAVMLLEVGAGAVLGVVGLRGLHGEARPRAASQAP